MDRNAAQLYLLSGINAQKIANENASTMEMNGFLGGASGVLSGCQD